MELSKVGKDSRTQLIAGDRDPETSVYYNNISKRFLNLPKCSVATESGCNKNVNDNQIKDALRDFWLDYCENVSEGHNLQLSEMNLRSDSVQLAYKIKLVFERQQVPCRNENITELTELIDQYVHHIIGVIQSMMSHYFEGTQQKCEYIACYLRRETASLFIWQTNTVEYEGKIVFPYAHIRKEYISKFYHFVINQLQLHGDTADEYLSIAPINGFDTLIQPLNNEIIELYGSSCDEETPPLKLYEIYGFVNTDAKITFDISRVFVPTLHSAIVQGIISPDIIGHKIKEKGIQYWLPLFFSAGFYDVPLKAKEGMSLVKKEVIKKPIDPPNYIQELLSLISTSRVEIYWSWLDIGHALHSEDSSEKGMELWKEITKRGNFKTEADCDQMWNTFDNSHVNIGTLEYFASIDNPDKYLQLRQQYIDDFIDDVIKIPEHTQLARAFKACFPHTFICTDSTRLPWYYYNGKHWIHMTSNSELIYFINEKFIPIFEERQSELADKIARSRDAEFRYRCQRVMTNIGKIIVKLSKRSFKTSLCQEFKIYYNNRNFNEIKNTHPCIHYAENGVIDTRDGNYVLRPGKPQDYITKP